ncbi:outer membrane beta-barrel protein [Chitinophaga solisilvae]|uniref:outer membrane beta-barrel protein n=1 Tax=Chitinophaga solisilvae TaxID=1233460 RepID=UPI00136AAEDC|nr:outer membrane beta-barrel protein [Chitinophaga solisilvae]
MKNILLLLGVLVIASCAVAQEKTFSFGLRAGIQLPQTTGRDKDSLGYTNHPGFTIGVQVVSPLTTAFSLQHDLQLAGNKDETRLDLFPVSVAFTLQRFHLAAGPYAALLLRTANYGAGAANSGYAAKNDLGFTISTGYTITRHLNISIRYARGFIPMMENAGEQEQRKVYRQQVGLTLGYLW